MSEPQPEFLGEFRLGRQMTTTSQVTAAGLTIVIGLIVLLPGEVVARVGTRAPWMGVLAIAVLGLTLLSVVELLGGSGEYGGTYILVNESLGGLLAFLTGWSILAASLALSAALLVETAGIFLRLTSIPIPDITVALGLGAGLIFIQLLQLLPRRLQLRSAALVLSAALLLTLIGDFPQQPQAFLRTAGRVNNANLARAVAWLMGLYASFEGLLAIRRQVRQPGRHLPQAIFYTLVAGGLVLVPTLYVLARLGLGAPAGNNPLVEALLTHSLLPPWLVGGVAVIALVLAANGSLMTAARQAHTLAREGALPKQIRRVWQPFPMPVLIFALLAAAILPLMIWVPKDWLVHLASALFLAVMLVLNVAAIHSHRTEPDRRRPFTIPFAPLVPSIAIALNVVLIRFLPSPGLLTGGSWIMAGILYYLAYARRHQVEARVGEIVFGRVKTQPAKHRGGRILLPIGPGEERYLMLEMATALARQWDGEVIPLQVVDLPDPLAIEEGRRTARERNTLFQWSTRTTRDAEVPVNPITRLARSIGDGIIDTAVEENCDLILLPWGIKADGDLPQRRSVLGHVTREAPCDVAVVSYHRESAEGARSRPKRAETGAVSTAGDQDGSVDFKPQRILVPTSGGPNAPLAIQLALLWAREFSATVTAVYISNPEASEEDLAEGRRRIEATITTMREMAEGLSNKNGKELSLTEIPIEGRVITASGVVQGISEAGEDFNLVLLGATEENLIDQVLFGNIPEQVARLCSTPVIIVKRYRGLPRLWLTRAWDTIYQALPELNEEEQIEVYRSIHRGARPDVDFFVMIGLSTLIATYGLFQSSTAVIIGAMLVAPLFSPLIAMSLSIAQGNIRLLRLAVEANLKGMSLAIGLGIFLAFLSPTKLLTPEILARTEPSLPDLLVALASGAAGAYAMGRRDVAAALPGVAIAAALVPPLSVIGIGLALGDLRVAGGSGLLFATNLVAIVLAGSVVFLLLGFRPGGQKTRDVHLRRGLIVTIVFFVLVTIPLGVLFFRSAQRSQTQQEVQSQLIEMLMEESGLEVVDPEGLIFTDQDQFLIVTVPVYAHDEPGSELPARLDRDLSQTIGRPVRVRLVVFPVVESPP